MSMEVRVVSSSFSPEQRREIALRYVKLRRGEKTPYAESLGLHPTVIRRWISALADGDLDNERFPRKTGSMTQRDISEVDRLRELLAKQQVQAERDREEFARQLALKDAEIKAKDAEVFKWEKAADALGKAIAVLYDRGELSGEAGKPSR